MTNEEKVRQQQLKEREADQLKRRKKFLSHPKDIQNYIFLVSQINDIYSQWGIDITSLSKNISKDYPIATKLMTYAKKGLRVPRRDEMMLYKFLKIYIKLGRRQVQMSFTHEDKDYYNLFYWGSEFLNMEGIDILYTLYLLLEPQLQEKITDLDGIFEETKTKILLPNLTFTARKTDITDINLNIHTVGNLNITIKNC